MITKEKSYRRKFADGCMGDIRKICGVRVMHKKGFVEEGPDFQDFLEGRRRLML